MSMNNRYAFREAVGTVLAFHIIAAGASGALVSQATGPTQKLLGTSGPDDAAAGGSVDLCVDDEGMVALGGPVATGDWLTSNGNGKAVATTTAGHQVIGRAGSDGVDGDVIPYFRGLGQL